MHKANPCKNKGNENCKADLTKEIERSENKGALINIV